MSFNDSCVVILVLTIRPGVEWSNQMYFFSFAYQWAIDRDYLDRAIYRVKEGTQVARTTYMIKERSNLLEVYEGF
jgi:hypothetical protein